MTRKDYEKIAAALLAARPNDNESVEVWCQWEYTVERIAAALLADNPRFDGVRFGEACGVEEKV